MIAVIRVLQYHENWSVFYSKLGIMKDWASNNKITFLSIELIYEEEIFCKIDGSEEDILAFKIKFGI